jgi:hypothetical protein
MTPRPVSQAELERQRATIEADFRAGWIPLPLADGQQRTLTAAAYAHARRVIDSGGRTGLDRVTIQAVRDGARSGDPLPPTERTPYIRGVSDDAEVIITGIGSWRCVAILFWHEDFPGVRFGHRFPGPSDKGALIWLMEEIETGALRRMMRDPPPADDAGIIWTTWGANAPSDP